MRTNKLLLLLIALLGLSTLAAAQSVTITPQKRIYRRPKPLHDFKRTFTIRRPVAKAATPALSRKITAAISPERVLQINIREEQTEYQWLEEADYKVLFNRNGVLSIELWMTGTGAYPDSITRTIVVDLTRGSAVLVTDVFRDLPALAAMIRKKQLAEIEQAITEMKADPDARPEELFSETNFTVDDLKEFAVDSRGVTFIYDYGFPHVLEALQPDGRFTFTWLQLKPFVRQDGLLARFVR